MKAAQIHELFDTIYTRCINLSFFILLDYITFGLLRPLQGYWPNIGAGKVVLGNLSERNRPGHGASQCARQLGRTPPVGVATNWEGGGDPGSATYPVNDVHQARGT